MHGGKRTGAGRKPVNIDLTELEKLCVVQCTDEELAARFGVKVRTIERRRKEPAFAAAMDRGKAKGRISVRHQLYVQATQHGNTQALLFLAKNLLGYRDARSNEPGGPNAGPKLAKKFDGTFEDLLKLYGDLLASEQPDDEDIPDGCGAAA